MSLSLPRFGQARILILLLATLATSCAPRVGPDQVTPGARATLRVDNQSFNDVNVYALRSGSRMRIGTVTGLTTRTFVLPKTLVGTGTRVQFIASFIGSRRGPVSEEITIWEGDEISLRIPAA